MGCASSSASLPTSHGAFHDKYLLNSKLCDGGYGEVFAARTVKKDKQSSDDTNESAKDVKIIDLELGPKVAKLVANEVARWKEIGQHEHIVQLHEVMYSRTCGRDLCFMVMEACTSTFTQYLDNVPTLNERVLGGAFSHMLSGLAFLHANSLVHRNIKHDCFTISGLDCHTIKLRDFGHSVALQSNEKLRTMCGTVWYMAPEMLLEQGYDEKVDVWSLGVLVYTLLFGRLPYNPKDKNSNDSVKLAITSGQERPNFSSSFGLSCSAVAFAMSLLERNPSKRPSAQSALEKSYISSSTQALQNDENDEDLPCLKCAWILAKKSRAFDGRENSQGGGIENLMNEIQLQKLGIPLNTDNSKFGTRSSAMTHSNSRPSNLSTKSPRKSGTSNSATMYESQRSNQSAKLRRSVTPLNGPRVVRTSRHQNTENEAWPSVVSDESDEAAIDV